jgi:isocitrate dehydrogenase
MTPTATSTTKIIEQIKQPTPITVAHGDGIGPEIMSATLRILEAAGAELTIETVEIGEAVFHRGFSAGIEPKTWDSIRRTKVFLKAPITTPQGGGFKSLNVTVRKSLGLFANVRPTVAFAPFVETAHPNMNVVIIRENEEDLYAGIEHRQTDDVYQCLKLITRPGCERIVRYAFEYARTNNRKKITCMTKDNIMKLTDGLFHKVFTEIGAEYPEIAQDHWIIDIGMAKAATTPEIFDVIVIPNLYGDIISDVIAEVAGSVGMAPSSNVGEQVAMFEAIHGSAPMIAGQNVANPSGLILSAVMMLVHIGQAEVATKIHNAWLKTIEDGVHTGDIFTEAHSSSKVGTSEFADAVITRLGQLPTVFDKVAYLNRAENTPIGRYIHKEPEIKQVVGIDIFVQWNGSADELAEKISTANSEQLKLQMITNRGVKVWPEGFAETFCTDHWRCRFVTEPYEVVTPSEIMGLMQGVFNAELDFIKSETLCLFNGQPGFSLGQGQ